MENLFTHFIYALQRLDMHEMMAFVLSLTFSAWPR